MEALLNKYFNRNICYVIVKPFIYKPLPGICKQIFNYAFITTFLVIFLFSESLIPAQTKETNSPSKLNKASVIIDGNTLFPVRGTPSYPAKERAKLIENNIIDIAENNSFSPDLIEVIPGDVCDTLRIKKNEIMKVFDLDAELDGIPREIYSKLVRGKIIYAVNSYRSERKSGALIKRILYGVGATVILIILFYFFNLVIKKITLLLEKKIKSMIDHIESRSFRLIRSSQIWIAILGLLKLTKLILLLFILVVYFEYVLGLFPWTRLVAHSLISILLNPVKTIFTAIVDYIPNLIFLIVLFFFTRYLLKLIKLFFDGLNKETITISGFESEWAYPTYKIVRAFLIIFAIVLAYPFIPGSGSDAFKGISIIIGLLFSLGSTSFIGNITAGYSMIYRRTFKTGDIVKIDDHIGQVIDIKLLVTKIKTFKNEEIVVPNSLIQKSNIINYSSPIKTHDGIILYTTVGIGYETPWRQVEGMLLLAAERTEGLLKEPKPFILQKTLGDFAISYELNIYCNDPKNMMIHYTNLHRNILDIFNENNIQIMTPAYISDPDEPKIVPKDQWFAPVAGKKGNGNEQLK